jgi:hypothetical protein
MLISCTIAVTLNTHMHAFVLVSPMQGTGTCALIKSINVELAYSQTCGNHSGSGCLAFCPTGRLSPTLRVCVICDMIRGPICKIVIAAAKVAAYPMTQCYKMRTHVDVKACREIQTLYTDVGQETYSQDDLIANCL